MPTRVLATLASAMLFTSSAFAQSDTLPSPRVLPWALIGAIGYGGAGLGVGYASAVSSNSGSIGSGFATIAAGAAAGIAVGTVIGWRASSRLRAGRPISSAHQLGVSLGAMLAGSTLGAIAAIPLINSDGEGTPLGSDEATFATTVGIGTVAGLALAISQQRSLRANRVLVAPYRTGDASSGLRVHVTF